LIYNAVFSWVLIPRDSSWLRDGYLGFCLDLTAITLFVYSGGGLRSEYFVLYYILQLFYSARFPGKQAFWVPVFAAAFYSVAGWLSSGITLTDMAVILFRLIWIPVIALLASRAVLRARAAEASLAVELRRAQSLLQAAYAPMSSLTVDGVVNAVLAQARRLTDSDCAFLWIAGKDQGVITRTDTDDPAIVAAGNLLTRNRRAREALLTRKGSITPAEVAEQISVMPAEIGRIVSLCAAPIPTDSGSQGLVVVGRLAPPAISEQQYEALSAFLQRATLAIQNAQLYEQLQVQIEELRSLHDQVVGSERLAALGQLAAKVAHELNNPLASIQMYNSLLIESPVEPDEQARLAESVREQVDRAKQVVMEILDYSRPRPILREVVDPNDAVRYGLRLVQHAARPAHVAIVEDYTLDLPAVSLDRGHMAQIVTNLTLNAVQAMPNGGTLTISTGVEDGQVFFRFRDTGVGISPSDEKRVFDAFFTTKAPGQGTGLGLAVCRTLVSQHHGHMTVESKLGQGSAFTVWLPPAAAEEEMVVGSNSR
jgi:signal transduction histidine kinase